MATWQADYILIPLGIGASVPKESRRDYEWWGQKTFPTNYEWTFQSLFTKSQSWAENSEQFGEDSGNVISVSSESGRVVECYARFDLRIPASSEYETFIKYCEQNEIELLDENNEIIEPNWPKFVESLKGTSAFQFVKNPQEYFKNISKSE